MHPFQNPAELLGVAWFGLSILLVFTVFFRFGRVWSLRNLDLLLLLAVGSGIVLVRFEALGDNVGKAWLLISAVAVLVRMLADGYFERRPRVETNLDHPALMFLGLSTLVVLGASIALTPPPQPSEEAVARSQEILRGQTPSTGRDKKVTAATSGPATPIVLAPTVRIAEESGEYNVPHIAVGVLAGLAHLAVIAALWFIGACHFRNWKLGSAAAVLYVLVPSTALDPNSVTHVLSAALILWALALHRRAWAAGLFMGLACGALLFPAFLLPIWFVFYGKQRSLQFGVALVGVWAVLLGGLAVLSTDAQVFVQQSLQLVAEGVGFLIQGKSPFTWRMTDEIYRIPIFVTFALLLAGMAFRPWPKRFEHLLAQSAAIIVAIQFWYPQQLGECLTGYIPLFVLLAFRPRLLIQQQAERNGYRREDRPQQPMPAREPMLAGSGTADHFLR